MAISFSCQQCGRNLKAPDAAAGKSSKCPGCGAKVTCPDAVYDAELLEPPPEEAGAFADPEPDRAYAIAASPVEAAVAQEVRRPCPMCGEMIIATAAKCRFCGEVFDETLKKTGLGGNQGDAKSIASAQRNLVSCIMMLVVCMIGVFALQGMIGTNSDAVWILVRVVLGVTMLVTYIGLPIYTFLLARKMHNTGIGILLALLALFPWANLLIAFMVNLRVNRYLKDNGYEVGLFGAKVS